MIYAVYKYIYSKYTNEIEEIQQQKSLHGRIHVNDCETEQLWAKC